MQEKVADPDKTENLPSTTGTPIAPSPGETGVKVLLGDIDDEMVPPGELVGLIVHK